MHDVFICYDEHDKEIADQTRLILEKNNINCWIKHRDYDLTDSVKSVLNAISDSNLFILILSKNSIINSRHVLTQTDIAFSRNIPIITFRIDESEGYGDLVLFIQNKIEINGYSKHTIDFKQLINGSCKMLDKVPVKTNFSIKLEGYEEQKPKGFINKLFGKGGSKKSNDEKDSSSKDSTTLKRPFKAYTGNKPYIFVSYAHKDAELVFPEIKRFHDEGYPIWYDQGLTAGQEWDEEIEEALMDSSLLVVFISENSMASNNVVDEIKLALEEDIDIVPIYFEDAKLARGLKLRLSQKHAIFKFQLHDEDYIKACFKAFDSANIPK